MPFHLKKPREGKTPFWYVAGHHGCVDINEIWGSGRSTRLTDEDAAKRLLGKLEAAAEVSRAQFFKAFGLPDPEVEAAPEAITLKQALEAKYAQPLNYVKLLIKKYGERDARSINKDIIEKIAAELHPIPADGDEQARRRRAATANRQVYTPIIAALRAQDIAIVAPRPAKHDKYRHDHHITQDELPLVLAAADRVSEPYGVFCAVLATSPTRENEMKQLRVRWINLKRKTITVPPEVCKNDEPHTFPIHDDVLPRLAALIAGKDGNDFAFPFSRREGGVWTRLFARCLREAGLSFPARHNGYHLLRHTYGAAATALGLDLVRDTKGWKTDKAADRYKHHKPVDAARAISSIALRTKPDLQVVTAS